MVSSIARPCGIRPGSLPMSLLLALTVWFAAACSSSSGSAPASAPSPAANTTSTRPPSPDPRVGLRAGRTNAGEASWNMRLIANRPSPPGAAGAWNSDLAFTRNYVLQGNYNGFVVWDASNPGNPSLVRSYLCPASQSDVSVYKNLLFVSSESTSGRLDCGTEAPQEPVSLTRSRPFFNSRLRLPGLVRRHRAQLPVGFNQVACGREGIRGQSASSWRPGNPSSAAPWQLA
jgi:hypothetical protein